MAGLTISDVVERTGVAEGTLRMWERRHGFPVPERLPSGHRRYSEEQIELVRRVVAGRQAGLSLSAAIERSRGQEEAASASLFASLRRRRPDLQPQEIPKRILVALSHAIEDESLARAEQPVLFASFQREAFYRRERSRWKELSQGAALAIVFADFKRLRVSPDTPIEIPVDRTHPLTREWAIVCDGEAHSVCLAGRERASSNARSRSGRRLFEVIWSVEPAVVREAARLCAAIAADAHPPVADLVRRVDSEPIAAAEDQLRLATAITSRTLSYLG